MVVSALKPHSITSKCGVDSIKQAATCVLQQNLHRCSFFAPWQQFSDLSRWLLGALPPRSQVQRAEKSHKTSSGLCSLPPPSAPPQSAQAGPRAQGAIVIQPLTAQLSRWSWGECLRVCFEGLDQRSKIAMWPSWQEVLAYIERLTLLIFVKSKTMIFIIWISDGLNFTLGSNKALVWVCSVFLSQSHL